MKIKERKERRIEKKKNDSEVEDVNQELKW